MSENISKPIGLMVTRCRNGYVITDLASPCAWEYYVAQDSYSLGKVIEGLLETKE